MLPWLVTQENYIFKLSAIRKTRLCSYCKADQEPIGALALIGIVLNIMHLSTSSGFFWLWQWKNLGIRWSLAEVYWYTPGGLALRSQNKTDIKQ